MPEITSGAEAINIASEFIEPHYPWHQPLKAVREQNIWLIEFDVGALRVETAVVKIDADTHEIKEFVKVPTTG